MSTKNREIRSRRDNGTVQEIIMPVAGSSARNLKDEELRVWYAQQNIINGWNWGVMNE